MVDIAKLKTLLKFEGIDLSDYTDDELKVIVDSKISELEGLIGLDVNPVHRKHIQKEFQGDVLELPFYPVYDLHSIKIDGECVTPKIYTFNERLGLIYFTKQMHGFVEVKYISGLSDETITNLINPLIKEMVAYAFTYNQWGMGGPVSSIKEGDVSVNYDTSNSKGNIIMNRIEDIKKRYCTARVKWI